MSRRIQVDNMYNAIRKINQAYEKWASRFGLTLNEMQIYYEIMDSDQETITQKKLCEALEAPKTSVNSIIKKQMTMGLISLQVNPQNKREKVISLTDEGKLFAKEVILPLFQYEEDIMTLFKEKDIDMIIDIQNQFADMLLMQVRDTNE